MDSCTTVSLLTLSLFPIHFKYAEMAEMRKAFLPFSVRTCARPASCVIDSCHAEILFFICFLSNIAELIIETDVHSDDTQLSLEVKMGAVGPQSDGFDN